LVPQSNISYKTIKKNQPLDSWLSDKSFEAEEENEEEIKE
jgi:hypothetical protein